MPFTKKDFTFAVLTGLMAGTSGWLVLKYLGHPAIAGISTGVLVILVPILWIIGVNFGYFLGRWMPFFNQFGKFVAVGFTNFAVDIGIFNLLFSLSGSNQSVFVECKSASFIIAALNSYMLNKYWAFNAGSAKGGRGEFVKFILVSLLSLLVNVAVAKAVLTASTVAPGVDVKVWANLSLIAGAAAALVFSFVGFRMVVFK